MSEACVLLAAGQGERMGQRCKALLTLGSKTFLETIVSTCRAAAVREIVVVVAEPHASQTRALAQSLGLDCTHNAQPEMGMSSSVALGFAHALKNFSASECWLWPVDSPAVSSDTLKTLSAASTPDAVTIPSFSGRGGHPVLVARSLWSQLAECQSEPVGARSVFQRSPNRTNYVSVLDPFVCMDVDHPEDLAMIRARARSR